MSTDQDRQYIESLYPALDKIQDSELREKVVDIWLEVWKEGNFDKLEDINWDQAWSDIYNWNNVDHTNRVTDFAILLGEYARDELGMDINMDYLIAGALLHDVDKAVMYESKSKSMTRLGILLAHSTYSVHMALKHKLPIEVIHMIATHTIYSVKRQMTAEALILHQADFIMIDLHLIRDLNAQWLYTQQAPCYAEIAGMGPKHPATEHPSNKELIHYKG